MFRKFTTHGKHPRTAQLIGNHRLGLTVLGQPRIQSRRRRFHQSQ